MQQFLDGNSLHEAFVSGYQNLKKNLTTINDLNVFPVPDGDTGTNLVHTFGGGIGSVTPQSDIGKYLNQLARAVLLSARGNSGVIFSQFIFGFARGIENKSTIEFKDLINAFKCAKEDSYNAIICPTEGTILTIISQGYEFLSQKAHLFDDFKTGIDELLISMRSTLAKTPDMLPVLKEAGVVDSGGAGLVCFFEGISAYFNGISIDDVDTIDNNLQQQVTTTSFGPDSVMEYGYCTEFILQLMNSKTDIANFNLNEFVTPLEDLGDSIVSAVIDSIVKIHIHTFTPEKVLEYARKFGELVTIKIENMSVQHSETQTKSVEKEKIKYLIVAVAQGDGIIDYFYNIGATVVINGGQTANPSVEEFLKAFDSYDAENIIVLPNNSNIILTANQAAELYTKSKVYVLPTKSIVEGYSALSMMNLWCDTAEELIEDMTSGLKTVISAYVTTATRDTVMGGVEITKDDYIGIKNKDIILSEKNRLSATINLIENIVENEHREVIIIFYGKAIPDGEIALLKQTLEDKYPLADLGFIKGNQDVYDYIISLE